MRIRAGVPSLRVRRFVHELERSLRSGCARPGFRVVHYSIQRDHAHFVVEAASARHLACGLKSLAARLARAANRVFRRAGAVLGDRSHVRVLRTPREVRNAIAYVLLNARRHAAQLGRVRGATSSPDPASSGGWFDGWSIAIARRRDPPSVAPPRTWLLSIGWRRHRAINPREVPGT